MNSQLRIVALSCCAGLFIGCGGSTGTGSGSGASSGSQGAGSGSGSAASGSTGAASGSASTASGSTGSASGSSTTGGSCPLVAGMYTLHFSLGQGSSPACPTIPDQTTSVTTNESPGANLNADGGMCTTTQSGCTFGAMCAEGLPGGATTNVSYSVTVSGGSATGTETITSTIVIGDASTAFDCSYGLSFTKD